MKVQWARLASALIVFLVGGMPCPVMGQGFKRQLTEADYGLWGSLRTSSITDDGVWISYVMSYPSGNDTLFVKSTRSQKVFSLPEIQDGFFVGNSRYAFLSKGQLEIIRLDTGGRMYIKDVQECQPVKDGQYLLVTRTENGSTSLNLHELDGKLIHTMRNISDYKLDNAKEALLFTKTVRNGQSIGIARLGKSPDESLIITGNAASFSKLAWSSDDKAVAFQAIPTDREISPGMLYLYDTRTKKLHSISDKDDRAFPEKQRLSDDNALSLRISDDHMRVFFGTEDTLSVQPVTEDGLVEIWKQDDIYLYPTQKELRRSPRAESHLAGWNVSAGNAVTIGKGQYRWALLAGSGRYVISCGEATDFTDLVHFQATDYFITDVITGKTSLLLAGHPGTNATFSLSPEGRYFAYLKEGNWWTYDTDAGKHQNATHMLPSHWDTGSSNPGSSVFSFGAVGWDNDGNLIINDEHDIWSVAPNGTKGRRLTRGKEKRIRYRMAAHEGAKLNVVGYSASSSQSIDLKKAIILSSYNTQTGVMGYANWDNGSITRLSSPNYNAGRIMVSGDPDCIIYEEQGYDLPPRVVSYSLKYKAGRVIAESNTQHWDYHWGHSEIITYQVGKDTLRGVLIYPAEYMVGQKYPMITYIYERLLHYSQEYVNPSSYNIIGINFANLSAKGYFILLPDIRYRPGYPGPSALECVTEAVHSALATGRVDPSKIGLTGHSFGGYETNYIIAHSKLFSAAVSGAGVSEIIYSYFSYGEGTTEMDYWRYEDQQFRIGKSFFEDPDLYIENSPVFSAANITTPLLTWAGKDDPVVRPEQSFMMYAAMRRLRKKNIMLLYDDMHSLANKDNQKDLTMRVESWFDHYLKGIKAIWIE